MDAIARATHLHRKTINRLLPDLIAVGNIERRDRTHGVDGKRECEYRMAGEVTKWRPLHTGHQGRETVDSYLGRRERVAEVKGLESLVLDLFALTVVTDLPDNLVVSQPCNQKGKGVEVWFGRPGCRLTVRAYRCDRLAGQPSSQSCLKSKVFLGSNRAMAIPCLSKSLRKQLLFLG